MTPQAKFWICIFVVVCDIGIVLYFASQFWSEPLFVLGVAALMAVSSIHVILTIYFGANWFSHPTVRAFFARRFGRRD